MSMGSILNNDFTFSPFSVIKWKLLPQKAFCVLKHAALTANSNDWPCTRNLALPAPRQKAGLGLYLPFQARTRCHRPRACAESGILCCLYLLRPRYCTRVSGTASAHFSDMTIRDNMIRRQQARPALLPVNVLPMTQYWLERGLISWYDK